MPHIRHTARVYDDEGNETYRLTAYTETPFGNGEWSSKDLTRWADGAHEEWRGFAFEAEWEYIND